MRMMAEGNMRVLLALLSLAFVPAICYGDNAPRHYDFVLRETNFTRLCSTKSILTVNGSFPGPEIRVHKNETVFVNVYNRGDYGVTIHWHGVKQPRNPWSDGPENVTQCKIPPGTNFTYEVILSTEEGTLWWHAHSDWSRATVHGAIIIYPSNGTSYPFPTPSSEHTVVLGSWFKGDVMEVIDEALRTGGDPNLSDALTINGQPGDLYSCSADSTFRLLVEYGKTYLLRLINAVMNEEMFLAIANHNLTVVGMDGAYIKPIATSTLFITPGQTMDVLVTANATSRGRHYIAASAYASGTAPYDNTTTTAIIEYSTNSTTNQSSPSLPPLPLWNDTDAATQFTSRIRSFGAPRQPTIRRTSIRRIIIAVSINEFICANSSCDGPDGNRLAASLNNQSFVTPTTDILQAYYKNITGVYNATFPEFPPYIYNYTADDTGNNTLVPTASTKIKVLEYNEIVELVFQGTNVSGTSMNHPMHLHGFSSYLVGFGFGNFNESKDPDSYNLIDPPELNTVALPRNGWLAVRFLADNPGVWFMHCHLERHASWGMSTAFIVKNGSTPETSLRPPPAYMPPC